MASKKFAHWNGFPFMTAPRTKYYSGQTQSPLFRLSREIRDFIYEYYALGEGDNGYHYDSETGKMLEQPTSSESKHVVRLGLMISCRIAAEELKNCAFRKLQFSPHLSQDDGQAFLGLASRAGRFQSLLRYVDRQKRRMLIKVAGLLQDEDWLDLHDRFPSVQGWFKRCLMHSGKL
ncbi:uncharacterized protein J4E88_003462 [Alternaria novae-zelandiae]|uniref:uncharacterized protein n=1 Tax=Alternaria novae-zelandiae TaxID=430562 RepID=UPI0020C23C80|nr:uncharacterized protein J4E88_003462 [Alternaria novae-zelandiae]KAI4687869.1 hypothetical protein J4E88_003462 [Alternaria novae-zelandiae]